MSIAKKLSKIQSQLKAPKGQMNKFGKYRYRSAEDILESVKPLTSGEGLILTLSDEIQLIGDRIYVKATARLSDAEHEVVTVAFAREEESKKGMDASQVTGAASSYARKYALNGLFCIDDTKDSDATNDHGKAVTPTKSKKEDPKLSANELFKKGLEHINESKNKAAATTAILNKYEDLFTAKQISELKSLSYLINKTA